MFGIKEKKKSKTIKKYAKEVNQNILNMITPSGVDFDRSHLNVSENIGTVLCISRYPAEAGFGWLTTVCNLESTQTKIEFRYTAPDRLSKQLNKRLSELKEALELSKEESEKHRKFKRISKPYCSKRRTGWLCKYFTIYHGR